MKKFFLAIGIVLVAISSSMAQTKIQWGMGANFGGYANSELGKQTDLRILSHWYNGIIDHSWIFGYSPKTISDWYAKGYGIQLMVWLGPGAHSQSMAYAAGDIITVNGKDYYFPADLERLIKVFGGSGPVYGPLYVVLFSEVETYGSDTAYKNKLQKSYLDCVELIHKLCPWAKVGLGFGGYGWDGSKPSSRDLSFWEPSIDASDFVCTQSMQQYDNWEQQTYQIRSAVKQLGGYGKPVMISHFEIWETPNVLEFAPRQTKPAFMNFMNDMYTDDSLDELYADGLRMWVYTGKSFIRDLSGMNFNDTTFVHNNQTIHYDAITDYDDVAFRQARDFLNAHNQTDPMMRLDNTPAPAIEIRQVLVDYSFDNNDFSSKVKEEVNFTVSDLTFPSENVSFQIFEDTESSGTWIRDTGYQMQNINSSSVTEAVDPSDASKKNDYIAFTVTPGLGEKISISWLAFDMQMRNGANLNNPPLLDFCAAVFYKKGDLMFRIGDTFRCSATGKGETSGWITCPVDFSKVEFGVDEPVEFRIYFWRESESIIGLHSRWLEIDNVRLYGNDESSGIKSVADVNCRIYPNPAGDNLTFGDLADFRVDIIDSTGRVLKREQIANSAVNVSDLDSGIYFAVIDKDGNRITQKFVKE